MSFSLGFSNVSFQLDAGFAFLADRKERRGSYSGHHVKRYIKLLCLVLDDGSKFTRANIEVCRS